MSKNRIVFIIGVVLFLIPFLGFPSMWENFFSVVSGISLIALSLSSSVKKRMYMSVTRSHENNDVPSFVDSNVKVDPELEEAD